MIMRHWRSFMRDPWRPEYVVPLLLINMAGSIYGYYWYAGQLSSTVKKLWLFVPDSPMATTLFAAVLLFSLMGRRNAFLGLIAFTACIKYGLWAVIVIGDFWAGGGSIRFTESMLWVSHLGMAVQGVIYLKVRPPGSSLGFSRPALPGVAAWMLLNDFMDYRLGIHPYLYVPGQELLAGVSAVALSLSLALTVAKLPDARR